MVPFVIRVMCQNNNDDDDENDDGNNINNNNNIVLDMNYYRRFNCLFDIHY